MNIQSSALHGAAPYIVRAFMQERGIPSEMLRADGRLTLTIDGLYRVHLIPASGNSIALQAELLPLPEGSQSRADATLARLARAASSLVREHASTLCIDPERDAIVLQQIVPPTATVHVLREAVADFAHVLGFWTPLCEAESEMLWGEQA